MFRSHLSRTDALASLDGQKAVWAECQTPQCLRSRECWLTTPNSHEQGSDWEDGQVREGIRVLKTGLVGAPFSWKTNSWSSSFLSLKCIARTGCQWKWVKWISFGSKLGSQRCHSCLRKAVICNTSYQLCVNTVITFTAWWIHLWLGTHSPMSFMPLSSDSLSKQSAADWLHYESMLLQKVTDRRHAYFTKAPLKCQRWADCRPMYTPAFNRWWYRVSKNSGPCRTWKWKLLSRDLRNETRNIRA